MSENKIWYIVIQGKADGPHTQAELESRLKNGVIKYTDLVFRPGLSRWVPVAECSEFERHVEPEIKTPPAIELSEVSQTVIAPEVKEELPVAVKTHPEIPPVEIVSQIQFPVKTEVNVPLAVSEKAMSEKTDPGILLGQPEPKEAVTEEKSAEKSEEKAPVSRKLKFRRLAIAGCGAACAMILAVAGINAYQESLESHTADHPPVALPPPPGSQVKAPVAMAQPMTAATKTLPSVAKAQPPVSPELEASHKTGSMIKIVGLKLASSRPQVAFETDLPGQTQINVEITSQGPGSILKHPSYNLKKIVTVVPGQVPTLDLSAMKMPAGNYNILAVSGTLRSQSKIALGVHDETFKKNLAAFKKKVSVQAKTEKQFLIKVSKFSSTSFASLTKAYKKASASSTPENKKRWAELLKNWKKQYVQENLPLKSVAEKTRNSYVYPEELLKLKSLERQLLQVAKDYSDTIKLGRQIASQDSAEEFKESLRRFQSDLKNIKK